MRNCLIPAILTVILASTTSLLAQTTGLDGELLPAQAIAAAQQPSPAPVLTPFDSAEREAELKRWVEEFTGWKNWNALWGNRRQPGWFSSSRTRRQRPDPPAWLLDRCVDPVDDDDVLSEGCTLLAEWGADLGTAQVANTRAAASASQEEEPRTRFWEHLHLDVLWPAMQSGSSLYGVVGMHATTSVKGRFQIFVAPGIMLLNVPTRNGGRAWKAAANYGIAYRLFDFSFPGGRQALLHLNLAKAWLLSAGPDVSTSSTDFVGFSITFKKTP
jgi:hypothetical protein